MARGDSAIEHTRPGREAPNGDAERTSRARDGVEETDDEEVNTLATGDDEDDGFEARFEGDGDGDGNGPPTDQANEDMVNGTAPHEQRALQRAAALQAVNQRLMRDPPTKPLFKHHRVGLHRTPHRG